MKNLLQRTFLTTSYEVYVKRNKKSFEMFDSIKNKNILEFIRMNYFVIQLYKIDVSHIQLMKFIIMMMITCHYKVQII